MEGPARVIIKAVGALENLVVPYTRSLLVKRSSLLNRLQKIVPADNVHPLSRSFPLMNPIHVALITLSYLAIVFIGTLLMKYATPKTFKFELKTYSLVHNFILVVLSAYMGCEVLRQAFLANYSLFGNAVQDGVKGQGMANIIWVFYWSKILEFNDTFIMIMKKNFRQVTFLHVYHHCSIFVIWWLVTLIGPGGEAYFSATLNSFVHVLMYGYYFASALGFKQVSFIKYYITKTQITQFVLNMVQASYDIYLYYGKGPSSMSYSIGLTQLLWGYMISMLVLFGNFLIQDQRKRAAIASAEKKVK